MIRRARSSDASILAALSIEIWLHTYLPEGVSEDFAKYALSEFTEQKLRHIIESSDFVTWVSETETGLDGYVTVCSTSSPPIAGCSTVEITTLYVRPKAQGRRKGQALLQEALEHCRLGGAQNVWLQVNAANVRAIEFYGKNNFVTVGSTDFRIADKTYENHVIQFAF